MHGQLTLRRIAASVLLPFYLLACTTWKTQEVSPEQVFATEEPDRLRLTLTDGSQVELTEPVVVGDTLMGVEKSEEWVGGWRKQSSQQVSIPLSDVSAVERREGDAAGTVVLVGVVLLFLGAATYAVVSSIEINWYGGS